MIHSVVSFYSKNKFPDNLLAYKGQKSNMSLFDHSPFIILFPFFYQMNKEKLTRIDISKSKTSENDLIYFNSNCIIT